MPLSPTLFRQAILAAIAISLVGLICDVSIPGLVPAEVHAAADKAAAEMELGRMVLIAVLVLVDLALCVAVAVGLYRFRPWARAWNLYAVALSLPLSISLGYLVISGLAYSLYSVAGMVWGAVTFATYFSDLASRFDKASTGTEVQS